MKKLIHAEIFCENAIPFQRAWLKFPKPNASIYNLFRKSMEHKMETSTYAFG